LVFVRPRVSSSQFSLDVESAGRITDPKNGYKYAFIPQQES